MISMPLSASVQAWLEARRSSASPSGRVPVLELDGPGSAARDRAENHADLRRVVAFHVNHVGRDRARRTGLVRCERDVLGICEGVIHGKVSGGLGSVRGGPRLVGLLGREHRPRLAELDKAAGLGLVKVVGLPRVQRGEAVVDDEKKIFPITIHMLRLQGPLAARRSRVLHRYFTGCVPASKRSPSTPMNMQKAVWLYSAKRSTSRIKRTVPTSLIMYLDRAPKSMVL